MIASSPFTETSGLLINGEWACQLMGVANLKCFRATSTAMTQQSMTLPSLFNICTSTRIDHTYIVIYFRTTILTCTLLLAMIHKLSVSSARESLKHFSNSLSILTLSQVDLERERSIYYLLLITHLFIS